MSRDGLMPRQPRWTMPEAKEMRRWYETGMSLREVGIQFGYEKTTTGRAIEAAGGSLRPPGFSDHQWAMARETRRKQRMTEGTQMSTEQETLGQRIRRLRLAKGMTQRDISEILNVHSGYFSRLEGDTRPIRDHMAAAIAAALGTTVEELTQGVREVAIPKQADKKQPAPEPEHSQTYLDAVVREEARASVALDGETQVVGEPENDIEVYGEHGQTSVLCFNGDHDRCHAEWCKCPHHTAESDTGLPPDFDLDQEAKEAEEYAEREQVLHDMELEHTVRLSIAHYLRREALSQDSRLVKAYVGLLADEIMARRDKRG